jgi:hypothetical protein
MPTTTLVKSKTPSRKTTLKIKSAPVAKLKERPLPRFIKWFADISIHDIPLVGGKNASLGEMYRELMPKGVKVPNGFAITAEAYRYFLREGGLDQKIRDLLKGLDTRDVENLRQRGSQVRHAILATHLPHELEQEIMVRIHRAGEGAPFTGLKPAGRDLGPAIPAADKALETGDIEPVAKLLSEETRHGLQEQFKEALAKKTFDKNDVEAGRAFVKSYVEYIHYVERLHQAATSMAHHHFSDLEATPTQLQKHDENR